MDRRHESIASQESDPSDLRCQEPLELNSMFGLFRAWIKALCMSQRVALGWHVAAPSGRNPRSATSRLARAVTVKARSVRRSVREKSTTHCRYAASKGLNPHDYLPKVGAALQVFECLRCLFKIENTVDDRTQQAGFDRAVHRLEHGARTHEDALHAD
jgi:hypothetical protein